MRISVMTCCLVFMTALVGCDKSVDVSEPGVYQGEKDPLVQAQARPEQQERLRERFSRSQTDR
jgi:hypothetical protein